MRISLIVAVADSGVIGRAGDLPWRLSADLRRFKELTTGHHLLLGRRTWESIGRPLPGRRMIVVSRGRPDLPEGIVLVGSVEEGIERARAAGEDELFVGGGAAVYEACLPLADRIYLTRVHGEVEGDVTFPDLDPERWQEIERREHPADETNEHPTTFVVLEARDGGSPEVRDGSGPEVRDGSGPEACDRSGGGGPP